MATGTAWYNLTKPASIENYNLNVWNTNLDMIDEQMHQNETTSFTGATELADGTVGNVPAPTTADKDKFLKGDGTWAEAGSSNVEANPSGTPTDTLETIGINGDIYQLPEGGETEITGDVEGSVIAIDDGKLNAPLKACTVEINPVQSGSGTPSPSNIRPISGWTEANITVAGTNVWDEEWEVGAYNANGQPALTNDRIRCKNYISVKENETYRYVSGRGTYWFYLFFDADKNPLQTTIPMKTVNSTITTPANAAYMLFYTDGAYGATYNNDISINYPSTDTSYHAYNGTTYNIEFEDSGSPLTVYGGTLDTVSGTLTVTGAIIDLGTLSYAYDSSGVRFYATAPQLKNMNQWDGAYGYCSHYEKGRIGSGGATDGLTVGFGLYGMYVYIRDTRYSDVTSFREAMNGVQLVYELATPTEISLTPAQIITTLYGKNVIWADSGDIAITYVRDTSIAINDALNQSITPTYSSGTKIADYNIGGQTGAIYVQGAGGHMDTLWTGNIKPTSDSMPTVQLANPLSGYDYIVVDGYGTYDYYATDAIYKPVIGRTYVGKLNAEINYCACVTIINDANVQLKYWGSAGNNTNIVAIYGVKI